MWAGHCPAPVSDKIGGKSFGIAVDDFLGHGALGDAAVHGLFFNVTVRLGLRHLQMMDQQPFRPVDQADLADLLLNGQGLLLGLPEPLSGAGHPAEHHGNHLL